MKSFARVLALVLVAHALTGGSAGALGEPQSAPAPSDAEEPGLMSRIDFGNAYVMGQSIKSGAVYLLNRKRSEIRSLLRERKEFRREIREDAETVDPGVRGR